MLYENRIHRQGALTVLSDATPITSITIFASAALICQSTFPLHFCTPPSVFTRAGRLKKRHRRHRPVFASTRVLPVSLPALHRSCMMRCRPPCRYAGDLREGVRHGKGILKLRNGGEYDGQWVNGRMHGYGVYIWPDAQIYKGEWITGLRHGEGTVSLPSGERSAVL